MVEMLLSIAGTLAVYFCVRELYRRTGSLWFMPMLICPLVIISFLLAADIPYTSYRSGGDIIQWFLAPVTVAFAIPLYRQRKLVQRYLPELALVGTIAAVTAMVTTMVLAYLVGANEMFMISLSPRSVTAPIAIGISEVIGGNLTVTAAFVVFTGVIGMFLTIFTIRFLKIRNPALKGLLYGFTAHGTGTARAYEEDERAGVMSSMAMIFIGVITAVLAPFLVPLLLALLT